MDTYTDEELYKALYNAFMENRGDMMTVEDDFSAAAAAYGLAHGYLTYGGLTDTFNVVDGEKVYGDQIHSYFPTPKLFGAPH